MMSQDLPPEPINPDEQPDSSNRETNRGEERVTSPNREGIENRAPETEQSLPRPTAEPQTRTLRSAQSFWETWQPQIKRQTITILRSTSQTLERLATRLESDRSTVDGTQALDITTQRPASESVNWLDTLKELTQSGWNGWKGFLPKIRARLPASVNQVLSSDRALTGAMAGILLVLLWTINGIVSPAPPKPVIVAVKPIPVPTPTPVEQLPAVESPPPFIEIEPSPAPVLEPPRATPLPTPSPEVSPPPPKPALKLTPEQTLIARIQDEVAEISNQYVSGLIQSVQANFRASRLVVNISPGWYSLSRSQQDNLVNEIYTKTRDLDFADLEIRDPDNYRLARSPVVGSDMVILKRTHESVEPLPETT